MRQIFFGGFTTFTTVALETQTLLSHGDYLTAFAYVVLSVVLSLGAAILAMEMV